MLLRVSYILLLRWFAGFRPSNEKKHISDGRGAGFGKICSCRNYILGGPSQLLSG